MTKQLSFTHNDVEKAAEALAGLIISRFGDLAPILLYPIPRGGIPAAYMVLKYLGQDARIVETPEEATLFIDDLIDSGGTETKWKERFPSIPFYALFDKRDMEPGRWIVFPWEVQEMSEDDSIVGTIRNRLKEYKVPFTANDNIAEHLLPGEMEEVEAEVARRMAGVLDALLIDQNNDPNTGNTAARVAKMYCREIYSGRFEKAPPVTVFPNTKKLDEVYVTGPISVRSSCSHHMCPIIGRAWIGLIPGDYVLGLSKFNRLVDWICSRPQIQEEMVVQVANKIEAIAKPKGLAVVIEASHSCMTWRGVKEDESAKMITSVMRGAFREKPEARAEFMALINR